MTKVNDAVLVPTIRDLCSIRRVIAMTTDCCAVTSYGPGSYEIEPKDGWKVCGHYERHWSTLRRFRWHFVPLDAPK